MGSGGWIKIHRCLLDKAVWQLNDAQRIVLFTILMLANHEQKQWIWKGQQFSVEPGQLVTSIDSLAEAARVSRQSVRTALLNLNKLGFLTNESTMTGRLISVINWASYQSKEETSTKEPTDRQQRFNKDSTPTKNDKNDKNMLYAENVSMTEEEHQKLLHKFGEKDLLDRIERLSLYKLSKGVSYRSDYATILSWARKDDKERVKQTDIDWSRVK